MRSSKAGRGRARSRGGASSGRARAPVGGDAAGQGGAEDVGAHVGERYRRIYAVVRAIPRGRVLTYGQVAELAGMPGAARVVGAAMRASQPELGLPWQRVVGKRSRGVAQVSIRDPIGAAVQRGLLEDEGVTFSDTGGISLSTYGLSDGR